MRFRKQQEQKQTVHRFATSETKKNHSRVKLSLAAVSIVLVLMFAVASLNGITTSVAAQRVGTSVTNAVCAATASTACVGSVSKVDFTIAITHQEQRSPDLGWMLQMALKGQFWSVSCWVNCVNGVKYTLDPSPLITNEGHDVEHRQLAAHSV